MKRLQYLSHPPKINPIQKIVTPEVISYRSAHDIPVYEIRKEGCDIIAMELVFAAGRPIEAQKLVASSCAALLREGAGIYSSQRISEEIDFLGATLFITSSMDFITIKTVCLKEQLGQLINMLSAIISQPHFSKDEWDIYKKKKLERLKVQLTKTDIQSYRVITEEMYGSEHPYGYNSTPDLYHAIDVELLKEHHRQHIIAQNCQIFISGDVLDSHRKDVDRLCTSMLLAEHHQQNLNLPALHSTPKNICLRGGSYQSSIRIARRAFNRQHEDYDGLNYLCNLLGGYFGSRLVTELREKRGLTYGIYSYLDCHLYEGDFMISTDVANENVKETLEGIYHEMEYLKCSLVPEQELDLVNNYMMGNYLNLFDGPFNSMRAIKTLALLNVPVDRLDSLIKASLSFDAYQIRDMAEKYMDRNDFWEVIVGLPLE